MKHTENVSSDSPWIKVGSLYFLDVLYIFYEINVFLLKAGRVV